jgi:hypothetical protein
MKSVARIILIIALSIAAPSLTFANDGDKPPRQKPQRNIVSPEKFGHGDRDSESNKDKHERDRNTNRDHSRDRDEKSNEKPHEAVNS